ncbi:uncharacterized protein B4U79_17601 [Dinothrombium tinctorium]|uniref:BTB domain-containing protein n=1 Tax=Dinothrombium tinctorium TaxID=1965070 RepID=A0A3S3S5D1_9ACAR|nr:uncharacterized protein B4U79_17628 [Dinothrombium tinctorium]RWS10591.1 uncharacterized protein B4U79_17601 [Dinothrombium tinctorium]
MASGERRSNASSDGDRKSSKQASSSSTTTTATSCSRRHRSTSSSSRAASKEKQEQRQTHAFALKCAKEQQKLRSKVKSKLEQDLLRLFDSEAFADFVIECDSSVSKRCHTCLFIARVPNLYKELVNNFKVCDSIENSSSSTSTSSFSLVTVKIPFSIEASKIFSLLRKIYSEEDIRKDEVELIRELKKWMMENSLNSNQSPHSDCGEEEAMRSANEPKEVDRVAQSEDNYNQEEVFRLSDDECDSGKRSVKDSTNKFSDSLEIIRSTNNLSNSFVNSDSLTNISVTNDEKGNEDESSFMSGANSLDSGDEDENGREMCGSSSSSQMVRSGTFDLLCQMPLEDAIDKEAKQDDNIQKPRSLNIKNDANANSTKKSSQQDSDDKDENDLDAETPIAEPCHSFPSKSPGSMFQFFVDVQSLPDHKQEQEVKKERNSSASSGFMFIDINSCDQYKSDNDGLNSSQFRSNSVSYIETKPNEVASASSSSFTSSVHCNEEKKCNSCLNLSRNGTLKNTTVEAVQSEEIPLLPMSPIPRRKRVNQDTLPRQHEKAKSSLDLKQIDSPRTLPSADNVMSSSWRSDCSSALSRNNSLNNNTHRKSVPITRRGHFSPSVLRDDDSFYSEVSSLSSSFVKDQLSTNQESIDEQDSLLTRTLESCSKLGEDLLRMFFDEINYDVIIEAEDREIKSHKCILVSRSPYFAAMFTGEWIESQAERINLKGFSFNSVHFALCHIYSGAVVIPKDNLNLAELAVLSDLLSLDTLKEVVLYELKKNYCHFFHKPCNECISGVIDCLMLSSQCGLENLFQRCLSWIGKYFVSIWPTKNFASLQPSSLIESCYQSAVNQMTPDNILEVILNCERLATSMPRVKWAEPIFALIAKLMEDSCNYVATNYDLVVSTNSFISLGKGRSWNISTLENTLLAAMNALTADVACKTIIQLSNILMISETETAFGYGPYVDAYVTLVRKMYRHCERYLIHNALQASNCQSWSLLSPEIQQHIRDSAVIVFEFDKPTAPRPKLSSGNRKFTKAKKNESESSDSNSNKKEIKERKSKTSPRIKSSSSVDVRKQKNDYHIYDEVPVECGDASGETYIEYNNNEKTKSASGKRSQANVISSKKCSQVAKVSPFTVKKPSNEIASVDTTADGLSDLVAEIDAESNLVNNCLQEAELLEQELTRKLAKQNISSARLSSKSRTHLRTSSQDLNIGARNQTRSRPSSSTTSRTTSSSRPPFK